MGKDKFTCDHILVRDAPPPRMYSRSLTFLKELVLLKGIINKDGGICDAADALPDQALAKQKLNAVRDIINRPENLVFFK